ncbi:uncharacterized protein TNCV_2187921 [Trichonephila clavipes]|nr:uncharacterized protein TNCV_2187921 [Trichonephila clavipes]
MTIYDDKEVDTCEVEDEVQLLADLIRLKFATSMEQHFITHDTDIEHALKFPLNLVNEDDIEELIMGHEDELTIEELQEIMNEEHQETQRNVSPPEQEEDERGPMPTSAIKDLLKKWEAVRAMVLE